MKPKLQSSSSPPAFHDPGVTIGSRSITAQLAKTFLLRRRRAGYPSVSLRAFCYHAALLALCGPVFAQPVIREQPQNQTNVAGSTAKFSVVATGTPPLNYQWRSYANPTTFTNIPGATEAMLVLANVQPTSRRFAVEVSNPEGAVTSVLAQLIVLVPPSITNQPADQLVYVGGTASFSVGAAGTAPLAYQWRFNQSDLPGKTSHTLAVGNAQLTNAGSYSVVVTNAVGAVTSQPAMLLLPSVHRFIGITAHADGSASVHLAGRPGPLFRDYYDLFPIEASTNLVEWTPLVTLLATNTSTSEMIWHDRQATNFSYRFYRTFTNHFITPLPRPSGPHPVGAISRLLTDPSRTNRYNIATNSSFMITLWFPAQPRTGIPRDPYMELELTATFAGIYGTSESILSSFYSHAVPASSIATEDAPYPVVIYSHGFRVDRRDNTAKFEELASHGYVVVSVDHADARATVFPDGRLLTTTVSSLSSTLFTNNVQDLRFVLETLAQMNQEDLLFKGALDLRRVGTMGWSYGGGVAAEICRTDDRVLATVLLEAYLQNATELVSAGLNKPFLGMYNASGGESTLYNRATHDTYWMRISNTQHQHFADWLAWISSPTDPGRQGALAMNACMLSFFDKYLKGEDNHLLDNPTSSYPVIVNYLKK